jgi:hypothetical protein
LKIFRSLSALFSLMIVQIPPNFPRYLWLSTHITDFADHIRIFNKNVLVKKCSRYICPRMYERKDHAFIWSYDDRGDLSKTIRRKVLLLFCLLLLALDFHTPQLSAPDYILKVIQTNATLLKRIQMLEAGQWFFFSSRLMITRGPCGRC